MSIIENLNQAIQRFNQRQQELEDVGFADEISKSLAEEGRIRDILKTIETNKFPNLNEFLQQPNVKPYLDLLGVTKSNDSIYGLIVKRFQVPRSERRFGYNAILAYVSPKNLQYEKEIKEGPPIHVPDNLVSIKPTSSSGLVITKETGSILIKNSTDAAEKQTKIEILLPEHFENEGIFESVLTDNITGNDIQNWLNERLVTFTTRLSEVTK